MRIGHIVMLPLLSHKEKEHVEVGIVQGDYEYKEIDTNIKHFRRLKWIDYVENMIIGIIIVRTGYS